MKGLTRNRLPQPLQLGASASACLDAFRALAALAVMFGHWRGMYFVDHSAIRPDVTSPFTSVFYAITGFGHQAVMVFFVLSGLLISSSILRSQAQGTWSWRDYTIDRSTRLYVVLLPGLLLGSCWDVAGSRWFDSTGLYAAPLNPFGPHVPLHALNASTFAGNLLFLQTRFTDVFGSNGPLWSLFNEFWYYVLFPALLLLFLAYQRKDLRAALSLCVVVAGGAWILQTQLLGFVIWIAGGAVALAANRFQWRGAARRLAMPYCVLAGAACCASLAASRRGWEWLGSDLAVGLAFAALVYGLLQAPFPSGARVIRLAKTLAGFSFSLYVLHFPVLLFIRAKYLPSARWQPDLRHLLYGFAIAAGVLLYAFCVAHFTESKTAIVRKWVRRRLVPDSSITVVCAPAARES